MFISYSDYLKLFTGSDKQVIPDECFKSFIPKAALRRHLRRWFVCYPFLNQDLSLQRYI